MKPVEGQVLREAERRSHERSRKWWGEAGGRVRSEDAMNDSLC